jgi:hypothetical protein
MVEQPGRWGHDALVDSGFPLEVGEALRELGVRLRMRMLLIKRRDRPWPSPRRRCFVTHTGVGERRLRTFEVEDPAELLNLDLPGQARERFASLGDAAGGPLFLVCTHGKHDPCCARRGAPLYRAVAERPDAWECTHIGGDRFAGNMVCFPHGIYYGRVPPARAAELAEMYVRGVIDLEHYRGRAPYSPAIQAGEHSLRERYGLDGVDDLRFLAQSTEGDGVHRIRFADPRGLEREVTVQVSPGEPRTLTCKATELHSGRRFSTVEA